MSKKKFNRKAALQFAVKKLQASGKAGLNTAQLAEALKEEFTCSDYLARRVAADAEREALAEQLPDTERLLSVGKAAEIAGVHPSTIRRACALGELVAQDSGAGWVMTLTALKNWQEHGKHRPGPRAQPAEPESEK